MQSPALVGALSQRYHVTAMLRCEKDGWHIDQRAFFDALHHAITAAHPTVSLPDWP